MSLAVGAASAEDIIQVVPFQTQPGMTTDDGCTFTITMNNSSADLIAYQFEILLPEGMAFDFYDSEKDAFELTDGRYPTHGRKKEKYHIIDGGITSEGWMKVMVFSTDGVPIEDREGDILEVYYTTSADMKEGVYPIYVKGTVLTISGTSDIKPQASTSYCYVGANAFTEASRLDLSSFTGYVPSFVVESLNDQMAQNDNLSEVDLSGVTELGADLQLPQGNSLAIVRLAELADKVGGNAVVDDGVNQPTCNRLSLTDGGGVFSASRAFVASQAGFDRVFPAEYWSTVCLPFGVPSAVVGEMRSAGCAIQKLSSFDEGKSELVFTDAESMEANTPYLVMCPEEMSPFVSVGETLVELSAAMGDIEAGSAVMQGSFAPATLSSDETVTYYAYDASDGQFVRVGSNARVRPFRAYISIPSSLASARQLAVRHGDGEATGIDGVAPQSLGEAVDGIVQNATVCDVQGRTLGVRGLGQCAKGVYVVNGKKQIIK